MISNQPNTLITLHYTQTTTLTYLSGPGGLYALHLINPDESESLRYLHTDHLGSWTAVTNEAGTKVDEQSHDAWGNRRSPATWTRGGMAVQAPLFDRGFTGHEHLDGFQLINMLSEAKSRSEAFAGNGRMYDPVTSRMLAPDNFVQTPDFSQNFNRYSYALNNPLKYTDPDGEWVHLVVGGIIGGIQGYKIGQAAGLDGWDLAGITLAGAGVGALTGGIANSIATGGGVLANTIAIAAASHTNSVGMSIIGGIAGVEVPYTLSVGAASMTIGSQGIEYGYLGKPGNSSLENIGYGFGALANIQDAFAGINGTSIDVKSRPKLAGHSQADAQYITGYDVNGSPIYDDILISVGPADHSIGQGIGLKWEMEYVKRTFQGNSVSGENVAYIRPSHPQIVTKLNNVNGKMLYNMTNNLNTGRNLINTGALKYGLLYGCVNYTSRSLFLSGVINVNALLPVTSPVLLNAELAIRNAGMLASPYLINF